MANHTLSNGTLTVTLPAGMIWTDEYSSAPVKSEATQTINGGIVVEQAVQQLGRKITLAGEEDRGWIVKTVLDSLRTLATTPGVLTLTLADTRVFNVMWDTANPVEARGLWPYALPQATDIYVATLHLIQV